MASESPESIERWAAKRRVALMVDFLKGETSGAKVAIRHGLTVAKAEEREKFPARYKTHSRACHQLAAPSCSRFT